MNAFFIRRVHGLGTKELFSTTFKKLFFSATTILVDKEKARVSTIKRINRTIQYGHPIAINPEGKLAIEPVIDNFKLGVVRLALSSGVDIIPTYIEKVRLFKDRQRLFIGERLNVAALSDPALSSKDNAIKITKYLEDYTKMLKHKYEAIRLPEKLEHTNYLYLLNLNSLIFKSTSLKCLRELNIDYENEPLIINIMYSIIRVLRDDFYFDISSILDVIAPLLISEDYNKSITINNINFTFVKKDVLFVIGVSYGSSSIEVNQKVAKYHHLKLRINKTPYKVFYKFSTKQHRVIINLTKYNRPSFLSEPND
jgi:hypothetical protein